MRKGLLVAALTAGVMGMGAVGCESHAGNGALIGGVAGAGVGAIIGNNSKGRTAEGAVIGGAAGAIPPLVGWAAVTGGLGGMPLYLFAIVFFWTPPHFWALSMNLAKDYEVAKVPMLPVTHGVRETTRQIGLYSVLMVALTLIFFAVAQRGFIYLAGAVLLGGLFLFQAFSMWREGTDRRAMRVYRYSITYLSALFALLVLDVLVFPFG